METRIVIVGGGVAGIAAAKRLENKNLKDTKIILISDKPHFEYHSALYRLVTGGSPMETCIPLSAIFPDPKKVEVVEDLILEVHTQEKKLTGQSGSHYHFDHLILTLGSETNYFNIPGLAEFSYGMKSVNDALKLQRHIKQTLSTCSAASKDEQACAANFVVVGGGPTGVELSADLIIYARNVAKEMGMDPHLVTVELIEAAPRILPMLPESFTGRIEQHIRMLGVNILPNRSLMKEDIEQIQMKDMDIKTKTVIWTAGVKGNHLYADAKFPIDPKGRVTIDKNFSVQGFENIYIGGDAAAVQEYWGMAQTAEVHGKYIAEVITAKIYSAPLPVFEPKRPIYAIPGGPSWAGVLWGNMKFYGSVGWMLRRAADLKVFASVLPLQKALDVFFTGRSISDKCRICS